MRAENAMKVIGREMRHAGKRQEREWVRVVCVDMIHHAVDTRRVVMFGGCSARHQVAHFVLRFTATATMAQPSYAEASRPRESSRCREPFV